MKVLSLSFRSLVLLSFAVFSVAGGLFYSHFEAPFAEAQLLTVQFSSGSSSNSESVTNPTIEVTLSEPDTGGTNTVNYAVTGGTAVGGGEDYTLANGTLTFLANDTSENIPLTVVNDLLREANDTIIITLSAPTGTATLGATIIHTFTITDDETMSVVLNGGTNTLVTTSSLASSVDVNTTGNFTTGTYGVYRWRKNAANFMSLNIPFFEAVSSQVDFSGAANHGTNSGAVNPATPATDCKVGNCLQFDGTDSVNVASMIHGPVYTISAWVKISSAAAIQSIVGICDDPNSACTGADHKMMNLRVNTDRSIASYFSPTSLASRRLQATTAAGAISLNTWTHVVTAVDSNFNTITIYVNGVLQGVTTSNVGTGAGSFTKQVSIGALNVPFNNSKINFFNGLLDEVQIYPLVLSAAQITQIYNDGVALVGGPRSIVAGETTIGETWDLDVTHLGSVGATVTSNTVTIVGELEAADIVLFSAKEDQNLVASFTPPAPWTGIVGYQWLLNGANFMNLNMPFNFGGTQQDISGYNNDATTYSSTTPVQTLYTTTGCQVGGCLSLNGSTTHARVAESASILPSSEMTIQVWAKKSGAGVNDPRALIFSKGSNYLDICLSTQPLFSIVINGVQRLIQGGTCASTGVWTHYVGTYDGTTARLYINGVEVGSGAYSGTITDNTGSLYIGRYSESDGYYLNGQIDEVQVYPRALTASQIAQLYADGTNATVGKRGGPSSLVKNQHVLGEQYELNAFEFSSAGEVSAAFDIGTQTITAAATTNLIVSNPVETSGNITIDYTCENADGMPRDILVRFSTNGGGSFANATLATTSSGAINGSILEGVACASGIPSSNSFDWNSLADAAGVGVLNNSVQIQLIAQLAANDQDTTGNFQVFNSVTNTFTTPTTISAANLTYDNTHIVCNNTTLTVDGTHSFASMDLNGCTLTQTDSTTSAANRTILTILGSVDIDATSTVNLTGKGYVAGSNPSTGYSYVAGNGNENMTATTNGSTGAYGGSHGGRGGAGTGGFAGVAGPAYGDYANPLYPGGGGGGWSDDTNIGGDGGGYIRFVVGDTFTLNNTITANGGTPVTAGGGGAGGGIYISATTIAGTGTISAIGGNGLVSNNEGGGGGGRIAIYYTNDTSNWTKNAYGGTDANGGEGGAGSIYLKPSSGNGQLIYNNNNLVSYAGSTPHTASATTLDTLLITNRAEVTHLNGVAQPIEVGTLTMSNNAVLTHPDTTSTTVYRVAVNATTIDIQSTASINVVGGGFIAGTNPSTGYSFVAGSGNETQTSTVNGSTGAYGGSYGGVGGAGTGGLAGAAGAPYGDLTNPLYPGGGGGGWANDTNIGGDGGGLIRLTASGTMTLNGTITANGGTPVTAGGGGAGGGIYVNAGTITGTGTLSAVGGNGLTSNNEGGGGGGRIAIYYSTDSASNWTKNVYGGSDANGSEGGAGTVYIKSAVQTYGDLIIDNSTFVPADHSTLLPAGSQLQFDSVLITGNSRVSQTNGNTAALQLGALTITGSAQLSHIESTTTTAHKLNISAASANITSTGSINLNTRGFEGGSTAANGQGYSFVAGGGNETQAALTNGSSGAYGGSYGGGGGIGTGNGGAVGPVYGDPTDPLYPGGGGGGWSNNGSFTGGDGGGLLRMTVSGTMTLAGSITANGGNGSSGAGGGGAGGGIYINANTITGTGTISAIGGNGGSTNNEGGGGGGRIAIYYSTDSGTWTKNAYGGTDVQGGEGGAGTIYIKPVSQTYGDLTFNNNSLISHAGSSPFTATSTQYNSILITSRASVSHENGNTQAINVGTLTVSDNGVLRHPDASTTTVYRLNVNATDINVLGTGSINVSTAGFLGGTTAPSGQGYSFVAGAGNETQSALTNGSSGAYGGSYAGIGGTGTGNGGSVGPTYGDFTNPLYPGAGGGGWSSSASFFGGNGGGLVRLTVAGTLTVTGTITANGGNGASGAGGGGAGGGIYINANTITGIGTISAIGGNGGSTNNEGGGGGGRIAIYYTTDSSTWTKNAYGGTDVQGGEGGAGTIYLKPAIGTGSLVVNGNNVGTQAATNLFISGADTQYEFQDLTVINGSTLTIASPGVCSPHAVKVRGTITTTSGTITQTLLDSNGVRCMDRAHQYINYPVSLSFTQPDIDAYDFYKRFSDAGVLQFALHSNLLYNSNNINLSALTYEKDGTKIAISIPADSNLHTKHTLYIPNTNAGNGVYLCPTATTLAGVTTACSGKVTFAPNEFGGAGKTVGSATGVVVTLVNDTDTGAGSSGNPLHLYKVLGLANTGGGPHENVAFDLNNGALTVTPYDNVQITNVTTNGVSGLPANTKAAYRWTMNGVNMMGLNLPFNAAGSSQSDFSGNSNNGTNNGAINPATPVTDCKVGTCLSFDGNDFVTLPTSLGYTTNVSAFAWFKSSGVPPGGYHIIMGGQELEISIPTAGEVRTGVFTSNGRFVSNHGSGVTDGNWHHVGFTFNGTTKTTYLDGVSVGTFPVTGTLVSTVPNRRIGQYGSDPTYFANGVIDEVQIYNRTLTAAQVDQICDEGDSDGDCSDGIDAGQGVGSPTLLRVEETNGGNILNAFLTPVGLDGAIGTTVSSANTVTINAPLVNFTLANQTQNENVGNTLIEVTLSSADSLGSNTVDYAITGTAVSSEDYTLANGTLTFVANDTSEQLNLVILDDQLREGNDTVIITLSSPSSNISLGSSIVHTYTITDNETMAVQLNGGAITLDTVNPLSSLVDVNTTGNFTTGTQGAYRWTVNGVNWETLNVPFNSGSSHLDFSGNSYTGTPTNGAAYDSNFVNCKVGGCLSLDGVNDYVAHSASVLSGNTGAFTVSAWMNVNNIASSQTIISKDDRTTATPKKMFQIQTTAGADIVSGSTLAAYVWDESANAYMGRSITSNPSGAWHHIAFVYDGGTTQSSVRLYYDNVEQSGVYSGGSFAGIDDTSGPVMIGAYTTTAGAVSRFFSGRIDEVQIYPRALSTAQIDQLYVDGFASVGGPTVIEPEHTVGNEIWQLHVTHLGSVGATVTSNSVTIGAPLINFALGTQSQNENVSAPTIEVTLSTADSAGSNTVNYAVTGTAVGGGKDYTLANGVLTFVANDTSEMIPLSVVDDVLRENNETVIITLNSPAGNAVLGNTTAHTYTITDNETMSVELNGGVTTLSKSLPLTQIANVNSTGSLTAGTHAAYRWILNGANYMALNMPFAGEGAAESDFSGNAITGTLTNGPVFQSVSSGNCKVGSCMSFDGVNDSVNLGTPSSLQISTLTASAWVKRGAAGTGDMIVSSANTGWAFYIKSNNVLCLGKIGTNEICTTATIDTNWHHVAVTYAPTTARFYIDGVLVSTLTYANPSFASTQKAIGIRPDNSTDPFNGYIDEVQVYNRVLSLEQIIQNCNNGDGDGNCLNGINAGQGMGGPTQIVPAELVRTQVWGLDVTHLGSVGATVSSPTSVTIISPEVNFSIASQDSDENITSPTVEVTLSFADPLGSNTVNYSVTGGTAVGSGEDYTLASGTLTFLANDTSENIPLTIVNDLLKEGSDTIVMTLSSPSSGITLGTATTHTLTIIDNETMVVNLNPNYPVGNPLSNNYLSAANPLESSVNVNGTGDFSAGTIGAYRWIKNGADFAHFSMPVNSGATQLDFSGNTTSSMLLQSNAAYTTTGCKVGGCLGLDGADDTLIIRNVANTTQSTIFNSSTSLSISAWVKSSTAGMIISNHNAGSTWESVYLDTSTFVINAANSNAATRKILSYPTVADGNWHHVVAVWTGANMYVYVDGAQVAGPLAQASPPWASTQLTYVGALHQNAGAPTNEITGAIDELQIYKRVLSAQQIAAMYNDGLGSSQNANDGVGSPASIVPQELTVGDEWSVNVTHLGSVGSTVASSNTVEVVSSLGAMQLNGDANDEVEEDVDVEFSFVGTPVTNSTVGFQWLVDPDGGGAGVQQKFAAINVPMNSGSTQIDVSGNDRDSTVQGGNVIAVESTLTGGGNQARYDSINGVSGLPFTIPATACLNYDIAWKGDERIGVDFSFTPIYDPPGPLAPSGDLRDTLLPDQNGYATHPDENISAVASDGVTGYYSRQINVSVLAGRQITNYTIGSEWNGPETKNAYIANIRLTNCSGVTLQTVYSSGVVTFSNVVNSHPGNVTNYRTGPPSFQTSGCKVGGCYSFNGSPGALESPSAGVTDTFSIEFWAKPTATRVSTTEQNTDLTINGVNGQRYAVYPGSGGVNDAGVGVSVGTNGVSVFEHGNDHLPSLLVHNTSITDWTHVVVTYDLKRPKLYLNGTLARTGLKSLRTTIRPGVNLGGTPFGGAGGRGDTYGPYMGFLDEFKIYPRVITPQQIYQNYLDGVAGRGGPTFIVDQEHSVDEVWSLNVFEVTNSGILADTAIPVDTVTIVPGVSETYMAITTPPSSPTLTEAITLEYFCRNDNDLPRDITVEYSTNGGTSWSQATLTSASTAGGVSENRILQVPCSSALPNGSTHTFVWDSFLDRAGTSGFPDADIRVRVIADTAQVGASVLTASTGNFSVVNTQVITSSSSGPFTGDVICDGGDTGTPITITMNGTQNLDSLSLLNGCILTHTANTPLNLLNIVVTGNVYIDASSRIDLDAKGYASDSFGNGIGPGAGARAGGTSGGGGGGGHGGKGAAGSAGAAGNANGSVTAPTTYGSSGGGGGNGFINWVGGTGGGFISFSVGGTFINLGLVSADGATASNAGGGAGGAIVITANQFSGTGSFTATGGAANNSTQTNGSGGGGRISLTAGSGTIPNYTYQVQSGSGTGSNAGAGTVYLKTASDNGVLIIDNNGLIPAINDDATPVSGNANLTSVIIRNGGVLSVSSFITASTMVISANGGFMAKHNDTNIIDTITITTGGYMTAHSRDSTTSDYSLRIQAVDVSIDDTSSIDLDGRGYRGGRTATIPTSYNGEGPGGTVGGDCFGCNFATGGAGHGGKGANASGGTTNGSGGSAYGSYEDPVTMGSGAAGATSGSATSAGGNGGGLVILTLSGTFTNNNVVSANGNIGLSKGGGAGGGINITANAFAGDGSFIANGGASGHSTSASGAGGRIALTSTSGIIPGTYSYEAASGTSSGPNSGAGTIYLKNANDNGTLIVDNNNLTPQTVILEDSTPILGNLDLEGMIVRNSGAFTMNGMLTADSLDVTGNGTFISKYNSAHTIASVTALTGGTLTARTRDGNDYSLQISANTITIGSGAFVNLNGKGYRGGRSASIPTTYNGEGPGGTVGGDCFGCSYGNGGPSHGGPGASGTHSSAGSAYGSITNPLTMGSGGGGSTSGSATAAGGNGGGLIVFTVTGAMTNNGSISADGENASKAGGAGGGINISAGTFSGSGSFTANGGTTGNADSGTGGGGRIALISTAGTVSGAYTFQAGAGGGAIGRKSAAGTIYLKDAAEPAGDLIVNNNSVVTSVATPLFLTGQPTQYTFQDFSVLNNATLLINSPGVCNPFAVIIRGTVDTAGGTVTHGLNDSNGLRCMNRVHQYQNFPATLTLTQPDIDNYDFFKRFRLSSNSTLQFALHSHLLYNNSNIDLTGLLHETDGTKIAISIPSDGNLHTRHVLYIPNTNSGAGVSLCPNATTLAQVSFGCSGKVNFSSGDISGAVAKTVGTATGVTVSMVNATDTGTGTALYKVMGLNSTGGGPIEGIEFNLNNGVTTAGDNTDISITDVEVNNIPGFPADTNFGYRWSVDSANLMSYNFPFDSGSVSEDLSGNNFDATVLNEAGFVTGCKVGGCVSLDGVNDSMSMGSRAVVDSAANFTISAWVYPDSLSASHHRVFSEEFAVYVGRETGNISFYIGNGSSWITQAVSGLGTLTAGQWAHVAWVKNGTTASVYKNGVFQGSTSAPATVGTSNNINCIGTYSNTSTCGLGQFWNGDIDEFQYYPRVLSLAEIGQLYTDGNAGVGGPTVIQSEETLLGQVWNLSVTPIGIDGTVNTEVTSANTVTISPVPDAISDLASTPGNTQVVLTWTAPADNGSAITDYIVEFNSGSGYQVFNDGLNGATGATVTGLSNGTSYTFRVKAVNANGESAYSNIDTETPATVPSAVSDLDAVAGNTQVVLTWTAPASNGSAITDYIVEYGATSGFPGNAQVFTDGTSASTGATVTGLVNGTDYSFQVKAVNGAGQSAASNVDTATPVHVPAAVTDLVATAGNTEVVLTWSAPSNNGSAITDYIVEYGATSGFPGNIQVFSDGVSATTGATVTGLVNGTDYSFQVKAVNAIGTGSASNVDTATPDANAPAAVNNLNASAGNAQVSLTWSAPANNGAAITDYIIEYNNGSGYQVYNDGVSASTGVTVTGLVNGTQYLFRIAAVNVIGTGPYSNVISATPMLVPPSDDQAQISVDLTDFLSFSIANIASGDEPSGDQPFGAGAQISALTPSGGNTYAISGNFGTPVYTQLQTSTNSNDGYSVAIHANDFGGRTATFLRTGGVAGNSNDQISDTVPLMAVSQGANASLNVSTMTGLAVRLVKALSDASIYESDEDTQWGSNDGAGALWAATPLGSANARVMYSTFNPLSAPSTAFINWFVGVSSAQQSGSYSGQVTFTASVN